MHGAIVSSFKRYLDEFLGEEAWQEVVCSAGLATRTYLPVTLYPDQEMEALIGAAEQATGLRRDDLLADFGEWVISPLMQMYRAVIPACSGSLELMLNLQQIHERVIRMKDKEAHAPAIHVGRCGEGMLEVRYLSARNMSAMIPGAIKGLAAWFGEQVTLLACEQGQDSQVRFVFQLRAEQSQARQVV